MVKAIQSIETVRYYIYNYCVYQIVWEKKGKINGWWAVGFFGRSGP